MTDYPGGSAATLTHHLIGSNITVDTHDGPIVGVLTGFTINAGAETNSWSGDILRVSTEVEIRLRCANLTVPGNTRVHLSNP